MNSAAIANLTTHSQQLVLALIRETNPDGIIRTSNADGSASPDIPATHHLIEVLACLDRQLFSNGIAAAVNWLLDPAHGVSDHPFAIDSFALVASASTESEEVLRKSVASRQLRDGSIPVFTAYLPGGDYFSTLWAVKILSRFTESTFKPQINSAMDYLTERRDVGCTSQSQLGFLGLLVAQLRPSETKLLSDISERLLESLSTALASEESLRLIDRLFILEDLLVMDDVLGSLVERIDPQLENVFALSQEAQTIPTPIANAQQLYGESLFLETIARSAIVGILRHRKSEDASLAFSVNELVHSDYRETRYKALRSTAALRAFLERYGKIHEAFTSYNDRLERALAIHDFEKCVFLMMPFRPSLKYRQLTQVIRATCAEHGYYAIRVDDPDRRFSETLWDNLVVNMLSCKYAIAVYVSEPVVDRLSRDEVRLFPNPNVALEFGFFKSRGQEVLLLKDRESTLPSDLQGFLWSEFDVENPDTSLPHQLNRWIEQLQPASEANSD